MVPLAPPHRENSCGPRAPLGLSSLPYPACLTFAVGKVVPRRRSPLRLYPQGGRGPWQQSMRSRQGGRSPWQQSMRSRRPEQGMPGEEPSRGQVRVLTPCGSCLLPLLRGKRRGQRSREGAAATLQVGPSPLLEPPLPCEGGAEIMVQQQHESSCSCPPAASLTSSCLWSAAVHLAPVVGHEWLPVPMGIGFGSGGPSSATPCSTASGTSDRLLLRAPLRAEGLPVLGSSPPFLRLL